MLHVAKRSVVQLPKTRKINLVRIIYTSMAAASSRNGNGLACFANAFANKPAGASVGAVVGGVFGASTSWFEKRIDCKDTSHCFRRSMTVTERLSHRHTSRGVCPQPKKFEKLMRFQKPNKANLSQLGPKLLTSLLTAILLKPVAASAAATPASFVTLPRESYHLSRVFFLRLLAVVYTSAFTVAKFQNRGLIGDRGITPARKILNSAQERGDAKSARRKEWVKERAKYSSVRDASGRFSITNWMTRFSDSSLVHFFRDKFWYRTDRMDRPLPTLLWLARDRNNLNPWIDAMANLGLFLSTLMLATGSANVLLLLGLWLLQRSFMAVGGPWYGYGWEPQLAELTFCALFLVPLWSMNPFHGWGTAFASGTATAGVNGIMGAFPVPILVIWTIRWYLFKIMMGAGLIKMKSSDPKWKPGNMSAMYYFYETQPVPNPLSRYFHFMPKSWHRFEAWSNHFVELVAPFLLLVPFRNWRIAGGLIQIVFQSTLIFSGNLSFLNWLTVVPAILCLDDAFLLNNMPPIAQFIAFGTPKTKSFIQSLASSAIEPRSPPIFRHIVSASFFLLIAKLNFPVVRNLLARRQLMNASFDKLRLASTYGAFGVVAESREELIIESANSINGPWKEYHFRVKPGNVYRKPRWISPYHYRLDWQMWIASQSGRMERSPWLYSFLLKLLRREKDIIDLLEDDPWEPSDNKNTPVLDNAGGDTNDSPLRPKYIRIEKYAYKFYNKQIDSSIDNPDGNGEKESNQHGKYQYWKRERMGRFFPKQGVMNEASLESLVHER